MSGTKRWTDALMQYLVFSTDGPQIGDLKYKYYSADSDPAVLRQELGDVENVWAALDLLVMTPTITVGEQFLHTLDTHVCIVIVTLSAATFAQTLIQCRCQLYSGAF